MTIASTVILTNRTIKCFNSLEERFNNLYNNKYDYSNFEYYNSSTKGIIICPTHGEFEQTSNSHLQGRGCSKCGIQQSKNNLKIIAKNNINKSANQFIQKSNIVHGVGKYIYDKIKYKNCRIPVDIYCTLHKEYFPQMPVTHLNGCGCPKCGKEHSIKIKFDKAKNNFIPKSKEVHFKINNFHKYDYSKVNYKRADINVEIKCLTCNNIFFQKPRFHIQGSGCKICLYLSLANNNSHYNKPTILYYIKISKPNFPTVWKIGITTKFKVKEDGSYDIINTKRGRFKQENKLYNIEVLNLEYFDNGKEAYEKEQKICKENIKYSYYNLYHKKDYLYEGCGDSELFLEDCYIF